MRRLLSIAACAVMLVALAPRDARALFLGDDFSGSYTASSLGSVPGLPVAYGGLTFLDNNTILIGGAANSAAGRLYQVGVIRDGGNHIVGFSGPASLYMDNGTGAGIGEYNDGGVAFGPSGVLFTSQWPVNMLGQTKPGSTDEDKIIDLAALSIANSHAALNFVPSGFGGAGRIKLVSWAGGEWYDAALAPDGSGTFDLVDLALIDLDPIAQGMQMVPGGPEGFVYILAGNPAFGVNSMLISEYSAGQVGAYDLDADGNPLVSTRRLFLGGLSGAEGAAIDPLTGDFVFSTFGGLNEVVVVQGFTVLPPPPEVPEPSTFALLGTGLAAGVAWMRLARRRRATR